MHTFYIPSLTTSQPTCLLSEEETKHACKVLRLVDGDKVALLNGFGDEFIAEIASIKGKQAALTILSSTNEIAPNFEIHVAIAPTKNMDRLEWFIEKTTELGITRITPILCQNSERSKLNIERLEKILVSAMKQSKRKFIPQLDAPIKFKEFITQFPKGAIAHCYEGEKHDLGNIILAHNFPILIGPEGDFSLEEVAAAQKSGYFTLTLGKNRLRTETAGLYACMLAKLKFEP